MIDSLSDYYFVRILDNEKYLYELITGINFRMHSAKTFRLISQKFQGDKNECSVIVNGDVLSGKLMTGKDKPETVLCNATLNNWNFEGYLYCFFALPKSFFYYEKNEWMMDDTSPYFKNFIKSLYTYSQNDVSKNYFFAVFDANKLVNKFDAEFKRQNYKFGSGFVNYKKINTTDRIKYIQQKQAYKILFEKDISYAYQCEYRYFIGDDKTNDYINIKGINLEDALLTKIKIFPQNLKKLL